MTLTALWPKLRNESDVALGRFVGDHGHFHVTPLRGKRGWKFPPLAECRDAWLKRFAHTDLGGGGSAALHARAGVRATAT